MDYTQLLELAEQNKNKNTNFVIKKRLDRNGGRKGPDPASIAAFKARMEREAKAKLQRAQQEKERLLALRAMNSKSLRKSQMMKSRTKDNDFSKIKVTSEDIEKQKRIEERLNNRGITDTRERMKTKIDLDKNIHGLSRKQKERALARLNQPDPIQINIKPKLSDILSKNRATNKKPNRPPPPPPSISYDQLLNLASENSKNKTSLEDLVKMEIEEKKQTRPMTQKEKDALKEEQYYKSRVNKVTLPSPEELHKRREQPMRQEQQQKIRKPSPPKIEKQKPLESKVSKPMKAVAARPKVSPPTYKPSPIQATTSRSPVNQKFARPEPYVPQNRPIAKARPKLPPIGATYRRGIYDNYDVGKYMEQDDYDEEEEEDDDMADFIDDGPEDGEPEYSRAIREIFGYDKRKYRNVADDDIEEASFSQVMREEKQSLRAGIQEDLEDMRREEEEKRLKAAAMKKRRLK